MPNLDVAIVLAARDLASGTIDGVRGSVENLTGAATRGNSALTGILQGVELGAGIAAFGALSGAIEGTITSSVKYQTSLTELQNNTTLTTAQTEEAGRVVIDLGNKYGVAQDQIVGGYRHVMDIVQNAAASQEILNTAVEASAASGANAATVANVLAATMHEYGTDVIRASDGTVDLVKTHDSAAHTLGVMTAAAQDANSTLDQWTGSLAAAIGMAAAGNQPLENIGAIFGALTLHGFPDAANAGTQVKDMLIQFAHLAPAATEELARLGKTSGIDVVNDLKLMNEGNMTLVDFIGKLREAFIKVGLSEADFRIESEKLIAGQRGGLALSALVTTGYEDMLRIQTDLSDQTRVNTVVDDTWNRTRETAGKQWEILQQQVSNFGVMLGSELLPAITPILKSMNNDLPGALAEVRSGLATAGQAISGFASGISEIASPALQFMADRLADAGAMFAPWAAQAGSAGDAVDKSLTGTSEVVQALQFLLQGNFKAAWADAQKAAGDFGGELLALRQVIDDNRNLILAAGAAFATWAVLGTVVPVVAGAVVAIADLAGGISAWIAVMGPAEGALGAIVALMGGPVTIAIAGVALAAGALALAWANNFDDIQGKTAAVGSAVGATLDQFGTDLHTTGVKAATLRDDINAAFDPINDNIDIKVNRWTATLQKGWDANSEAARSSLATFATTVQTGLDAIDVEVGTWQVSIHDKILQAFSDSGIAAQIQTLGQTIDNALKPITDTVGQWQVQIHNAISSAWNADTPSSAGGPGGIPNWMPSGGSGGPGAVGLGGTDYRAAAVAAAQKAGIDQYLFSAQIEQESGFSPTNKQGGVLTSPAGALGIAQFMPGTARSMGVDPTDALASLDAAARMDAQLLQKYGDDWSKVLASYNAGEGAVDRYGGVPPYAETQSYVSIITSAANRARAAGGPSSGMGLHDNTVSSGPASGAGLHDYTVGGDVSSGTGGGTTSIPGTQAGSDYLSGGGSASKLNDLLATEGINWTKTLETETNRIAKSVADEQTKLAKADADAGRATAKVDADSARAIVDVGTNRAVQDDLTKRKEAQAQIMQDDKVANDQQVAAQELTYQRGLQNEQIAHSRQLEDTQIQTQQTLAAQQLTHSRTLQDQEIQYQDGLQKDAVAHARQLEDAKIVSDQKLQLAATEHQRALQDQQTLVNEQLAAAQLVHQRQLQDAAIPVAEGLQDTATGHSRTLQDAQTAYDQQKSQQRDAAAYQLQLQQATSDVQRAQITQSHNQTLQNMALQRQYAAEDLAHRRQVEDEEAKYQEGLQAAALARSRKLQDDEIQYQRGVAENTVAAQRVRDDQEAAYQRNLAATALAQNRVNADAEQAYQDNLKKVALDHSRSLQDADIQYQNEQAAKALAVKRVLEDAALADQRTKEDAAIQHKADMEAAARQFAAAEKAKQDAFDKQLADEADKRAIDKINADAERAKKDIADRLILQKQAIIEAAQTQRDAEKLTFDEAATAIIEKARIAVTKAGGDFDPIEASMKASVAAMDTAFATAHDNSAAKLVDLAAQTLANLGDRGVIPTAIGQTAKKAEDDFGVSDRAVELFAQQFGKSWEEARPLLGQIEQGIYTNMGANGLIPNHIKTSNDKVIEFARQWGISWPEAAGILTTESDRIKATFGAGGEVPSAMAASTTAAGTLNNAIQGIQDKTITVTTNYISSGSQAASGAAGASPGAQTGSRSGGGEATGGPGPVAPSSSADTSNASPTGQHIGESGPGGIYNDPTTGHPYTHAAGGVTTGPIFGWDSAGNRHTAGEAGPEAIIPLGEYFVSKKSDALPGGKLTREDARMIAEELAIVMQGISLNVGVDPLHSALLQKARRTGKLGLS